MRRKEYFELLTEFKLFLLNEGRLENVAAFYPETYSWIIEDFAKADPSGNLKYLDWMMKEWWRETKREENPHRIRLNDLDREIYSEIVNAIEIFHLNLQRIRKKDINSYSYDELLDFLIDLPPSKTELKRAEKKAIKIFENDDVLVLIPLSKQASCAYGADTAWCISGRISNKWEEYTEGRKDFFVFVSDKNAPRRSTFSKVSVLFKWDGEKYRKSFWTSGDRNFYPQDEPEWKWFTLVKDLEFEIIKNYEKYLSGKHNLKERNSANGN